MAARLVTFAPVPLKTRKTSTGTGVDGRIGCGNSRCAAANSATKAS